VSTKAKQDPPPVRAFYLATGGGDGPVKLVLLGGTEADEQPKQIGPRVVRAES